LYDDTESQWVETSVTPEVVWCWEVLHILVATNYVRIVAKWTKSRNVFGTAFWKSRSEWIWNTLSNSRRIPDGGPVVGQIRRRLITSAALKFRNKVW